jgi:hypothetical protein
MQMHKKWGKFLAGTVLSGWSGFCLAVYSLPQYFFYSPDMHKAELSNAHQNGFPAEEVEYISADGTKLYGWYVKPSTKQKIIVFFHGNSHNIEAFYHKLVPLIEAGYGVFIGEYRGFGGVKGTLRQKNLAADAVAAVTYLHTLGWQNSALVLYGMSLGSYTSSFVAHELGLNNPFAGLILEVPFDNVINVVRQRFWPVFPLGLIIRDTYDNVPLVQNLPFPTLILAAERDKTVPVERAQALFDVLSQPKEIKVYAGAGHTQLYNYRNWRDILQWLEKNEKAQ